MAYMTFEYKSMAQMKGVTIRAYIPDAKVMGLDPNPLKTVYFLPGFSADSTEIVTYLRLRRQAELKNMAIIVVDGENRFYIDHPEKYQSYSTFVGQEVVEMTRRMLPLSTRREDTCIAGISMGGYGALYNGLKYKDTFGKIAAMSPATDIYRLFNELPDAGFKKEQLFDLFGTEEDYRASDYCLDTFYSRDNLEGAPEIFVCCGDQDHLTYPMGRDFAEAAAAKGYDCRYLGGDGDHETDYWEEALDPVFSFLAGIPAGSRDKIMQLFTTEPIIKEN